MGKPSPPLPLKSALCVCFWVSVAMTTSHMKLPNINQEARIYCQMFGRQPSWVLLTQNDGEWFLTFVNHEFFMANLKIDNQNNSYAITLYKVWSIFITGRSGWVITGLGRNIKLFFSMAMRAQTAMFLTTVKTSAHRRSHDRRTLCRNVLKYTKPWESTNDNQISQFPCKYTSAKLWPQRVMHLENNTWPTPSGSISFFFKDNQYKSREGPCSDRSGFFLLLSLSLIAVYINTLCLLSFRK